jgi:hypothetical protein
MLTDGTKNIIEAMKKAGSKRLAVVTSIGAGDSEDQAPFFFKVRELECPLQIPYLTCTNLTGRYQVVMIQANAMNCITKFLLPMNAIT